MAAARPADLWRSGTTSTELGDECQEDDGYDVCGKHVYVVKLVEKSVLLNRQLVLIFLLTHFLLQKILY